MGAPGGGHRAVPLTHEAVSLLKPHLGADLLTPLPEVVAHTDPLSPDTPLTPREVEVMDLLAQGLRLVDIATKTGTSPRTVSTHKRRLYAKMGWDNDPDMFAFLVGKGLVSWGSVIWCVVCALPDVVHP